MKKLFFSIIAVICATGLFAQETEVTTEGPSTLVSEKGENYLPEAKDWAISFDATPIFSFVGNAFNGTSGNSGPGVNYLNGDQTIVGKLFVNEKTAYRALIRIGFTSETDKKLIADATAAIPVYPDVFATVEDKFAFKNISVGIGAGIEKRRGKTRLQGFYGADAMVWFASTSSKYTYGNDLTNLITVNTVTTTDFDDNLFTDQYGNQARITSDKSGMTIGVGVRGFIGAEYFLFPKISIGAEYGWGIGFQTAGKGKTEAESVNTADAVVGDFSFESVGDSKFGADTDINQGTIFGFNGSNTGTASLRLTLHF